MAPEVIFERTTVIALARVGVVRWKALGTPVLSAAGRCVVVQVAAHGRCVLVQRTIHKNLHFKNSIARLFRQAGHGA